MKSFFNSTCCGNIVGDGSAGATVSWLEKYINILFPENGIEYWSDNQFAKGSQYLKRSDRLPESGVAEDSLHHVACYVRQGTCEGRIIEAAFALRNGGFKSLTWIKTFGSEEESWLIARAIDAALNSILVWEEVPEIVSMSEKVPRQYHWYRHTSLIEEVIVLSGMDRVKVSTPSGLVLDERSWADQGAYAGSSVLAVVEDWVTVLTNTNAEFRLVQVENDRVLVPDLPGYIISKRGVDVAGFYVLPPGGIETDDRTYLGYFSRLREAIQACRDHSSRQQLGELVCCKGEVAHG